MLWIYVLAATLGFVLMVPTMLRVVDGLAVSPVTGSVGFAAAVFGPTGLLLQQFEIGTTTTLIAAASLGLAAAAIHPEIVKAVAPRNRLTCEDAKPHA